MIFKGKKIVQLSKKDQKNILVFRKFWSISVGGHPAKWMGIFHTDFGTNAVVPKFQCNGSVDTSGAMDGFFPVGSVHGQWHDSGNK